MSALQIQYLKMRIIDLTLLIIDVKHSLKNVGIRMNDRLRANIATIDEADLSSFHVTEQSEREEGLKFINGVCADLGFDYLQFGMWNPRKGKNGTVLALQTRQWNMLNTTQSTSFKKWTLALRKLREV